MAGSVHLEGFKANTRAKCVQIRVKIPVWVSNLNASVHTA